MTLQSWLALSLVVYVPGALVFRLPLCERDRRASLPAEERAYWAIIISVLLSSVAALGLAAGAGGRESTRLNSRHANMSDAEFRLKKKHKIPHPNYSYANNHL